MAEAPAPAATGVAALSGDDPDQAELAPAPAQATGEATLLRYRDDPPVDEPAVTLDAFLSAPTNAGAVRLAPGEDARALLPHLGRLRLVEIGFPSFRDGRGYSAARVLREGGYTGELRAAGDVLVDQLPYMRRCGFDGFAPAAPIDPDVLARSLARYPHPYQPAADTLAGGAAPIWKLRHG